MGFLKRCYFESADRVSAEIVAAQRKFLCWLNLRYRWQAAFLRGEALAPRLDKGGENGERQRLVLCFHGFIEAYGKLGMLRERAVPHAVLMNQTAKAPPWQLEFDQGQRRICVCA